MRHLLSLLLFSAFSSNLLAEDLTKSQCETIGGTFTKAGCLMFDENEKAKYERANIYMPRKEECECQGGTWHEKYGCMAKISKEQCESLGGEMQADIGCVQKMPLEQCKKLGGSHNKEGSCYLTPQPNSSIDTDASDKAACAGYVNR